MYSSYIRGRNGVQASTSTTRQQTNVTCTTRMGGRNLRTLHGIGYPSVFRTHEVMKKREFGQIHQRLHRISKDAVLGEFDGSTTGNTISRGTKRTDREFQGEILKYQLQSCTFTRYLLPQFQDKIKGRGWVMVCIGHVVRELTTVAFRRWWSRLEVCRTAWKRPG